MNAAGFVVRRAEAVDVAATCRIYNRYVSESTATFHCRKIGEEQFGERLLRALPYGGLVAVAPDGEILGYAVLGPYIDRCAARWSVEVAIYMAPGACGSGVGSALLAAAERQAQDCSIRTVVAAICSENTRSCRFFHRSGYRHCGSIEMAAQKFGRTLGVEYYQKIFPQAADASMGLS